MPISNSKPTQHKTSKSRYPLEDRSSHSQTYEETPNSKQLKRKVEQQINQMLKSKYGIKVQSRV